MNTLPRPSPLVVIILDGWGISFIREGNAVALSPKPILDDFARYYPATALRAASIEVGLPWGEAGNSETGHRNIGAGQVQYQILPLINRAIDDGSFFKNPVFLKAIDHIQRNKSHLHIMGLASTGGVHSHINHLLALLKLAARHHVGSQVFIHMFTDGRDVPPQTALSYVEQLEKTTRVFGGKIASVTGRIYAMDRNQNWHRTQSVYETLTGLNPQIGAPNARAAIEQAYQQKLFDEVIPPTIVTHGGKPLAEIRDHDAVLFFNFRPDRARQLTQAFADPGFQKFPRKPLTNLFFATMAPYSEELPVPAAYHEAVVEYPVGRLIADAGLSQLHIAETEKYAHVTYYLNTGREKPFLNEKQMLIRSSGPKNFAQWPHMSADEITHYVLDAMQKKEFDVYFINFANADMIGHTGDLNAAVQACSFLDVCIGKLSNSIIPQGGALLITADHGNAEQMINPVTGEKDTEHTSNPVPLYYVHYPLKRSTPRTDDEVKKMFGAPLGVLADVAPTILEVLHIPKHPSMTGVSLLDSLM